MRLCLAIAALSLLAACDSVGPAAPSGPESLTVDFTTHFDDDLVRVELDGVLIYEERLTTADVLSLAERVVFSIPEGEHRIRIEVAGQASAATFEAGQIVFIGVGYDPEEQDVELVPSDEVFCCYD